MFIQYASYNHSVSLVELNENEDILLLKTSLYTYRYVANGDCCSSSVFKVVDKPFSSIVGKIIKSIKEIYDFEYNEEEEDAIHECITPHMYEMSFKDSDDIFKFLMVNYSNGYYDGWISSYIVL
jgi:hypothetical protein